MAKTTIHLLNQKEITDINSKMVVSNLFIKWKEEILKAYDGVEFLEDSHQYFLNGVELEPVSHVIHNFQPEENWDLIAENYAIKNKLELETVKRSWLINNKISTNSGTHTHEFGESCFYYYTGQFDKVLSAYKRQIEEGFLIPNSNKEIALSKFWNDLIQMEGVIPMLAETRVHTANISGLYPYCGTFDLLIYFKFKNGTEGLIIFDYKTNGELTNDYNRKNNKTLLPPFNGLTNEAMSLYTLQLSAYQIPIQKQLNIPILGRRIVWLKDNGTYEIIPTEDKTDELFNVLSTKIA